MLPKTLTHWSVIWILGVAMAAGVAGYMVRGGSADGDASVPIPPPTPMVPPSPPTPPPPGPVAPLPDRNTATCITTPMSVPDDTWAWITQQATAAGTATQDVIAQRLQTMDLDAQAADYARTNRAGQISVPCWLVDEVEKRLHSASTVVSPATVTRWLEAGLVASVQSVLPTGTPPGALSKTAVTAVLTEAGWPATRIAHALCITWHESKWDPVTHNTHDPGLGSYGLFQIEAWWASTAVAVDFGPRFDLSQAFDPAYNARFALRVFEREGWRVWGTAHFCVGI